MLKRLIGQWKVHRKKPPLLPEDGEIPNGDPSRVNPLFEDSEASVTSSQLPDPESHPVDSNTQSSDGNVDLDLVDISIPTEDLTESADDAINQINAVLDSAFDNESVSLDKNTVIQIESNPKPNDELPGASTDNVEVKSKSNETDSVLSSRASSSNVYHELEPPAKSSDPPKESPPASDNTNSQTQNGISYPRKIENTVKKEQLDKEMVPGTNTKTQQSSGQMTRTSSSATKDNGGARNVEKFTSNNPAQEPDMTNLKTRAISELIKKFQANDDIALNTVPSFLHSPKRKEVLNFKNPPIKKEIKSSEPEKIVQKEALSNIFNFPPPPPPEPIKNNSSIIKDSVKEIKTQNAEQLSKTDDSSPLNEGRTISDSSLSRNITVSSRDPDLETKTEGHQAKELTKSEPKKSEVPNSTPPPVLSKPTRSKDVSKDEPALKKGRDQTEAVETANKNGGAKEKSSSSFETEVKTPVPDHSSFKMEKSNTDVDRKESKSSKIETKQKVEKQTSGFWKQTSKATSSRTDVKGKSATSETLLESAPSQKETEAAKSHSEDSGITRGDQISSEASPDIPKSGTTPATGESVSPATKVKKPSKEKRTVHNRKSCKRCKRARDDGTSMKRGQCEDYYDVLTGANRKHRKKHSESWASDLSWEEKELIRRLRSRRNTLYSNSPSSKSKNSRPNHHENGYFHRQHAIRRSVSDESNFNNSSMCSCDECWLFLVKDYAYGRASLRAPTKAVCTCRTPRPDFLGRKVKFHSDTIPEATPSERTSVTTPIPEEPSKEEDSADSPSNDSSTSPSGAKQNGKSSESKEKKSKSLKENYLLVTPWELEEWDLARRKKLLLQRRKRARYMGFMALGMVVFIGLVVAVLMVYLRRRVL